MSILNAPYFRDEEAAFAKLESIMWSNGPECPHCGTVNDASKIPANPGKKVRYGLYRCNSCKAQFTVTVGTVFESSHIPLHKWLQAAFLLNSSKKGISAKQIERILQITYKSAWFMMHRLRETMAEGMLNPFGSQGGAVEADETYIGRWRRKGEKERGGDHKMKVLTLIDRDTKRAKSTVMEHVYAQEVARVVAENVAHEAHLMTDSSKVYVNVWSHVASHEMVNHSEEEYRRGDCYTNTVEGYFSIFKRGMKGIYQHCAEKHLHRYLAEFDFRYSHREALGTNDLARTERALKGARGKRLTYRWPDTLATVA